ncbi:MAG: dTDP-4-dehydrorhamnose reductase [Mesorhizobium sp.]|nr:dTDP-4-dehydrorhamnose reductase [Mesorhizobium sp.]
MVARAPGAFRRWRAVGIARVKLLVFGRSGQVAQELRRQCPDGWQMLCLGRSEADLGDPDACASIVSRSDVDAVINAAAYTAVDRAEAEEDLARLINGAAPAAMARAAAAKQMPFLHISTDYVFDGSGSEPRKPGEKTNPLNAYGRTKLAGENGVIAAGGSHAILRTSWVFSAHGSNFVKTMLRLGAQRDTLDVVADQIGGPTAAADIASALLTMAQAMAERLASSGTFHFAGEPDVSWADFAREIFRQSNLSCEVRDIPTSAYPTPARRPANSRLDCTSLAEGFGIERPDWRAGLARILQELEKAA